MSKDEDSGFELPMGNFGLGGCICGMVFHLWMNGRAVGSK